MKNCFRILFILLAFVALCSPQNSFFGWMNGGNKQPNQDNEKFTAKSNISPLETNSLENVNISQNQKQLEQPISANPNFPKTSSAAINNALINTNFSNVIGGNISSFNSTLLQQNQTVLSNILGSEVAEIITTVIVFFGALLGREGCDMKAACIAGWLLPQVQGRDIAMVAAEPLIPDEWKQIYQAMKVSLIQGQDCSRFNCF